MATSGDICQSCKDDRINRGQRPVTRIKLPDGITIAPTFWREHIPVYVCPHCDGDTLVNSALRAFQEREVS